MYLGFDVLTQRANARGDVNDTLPRKYTILDPGMGSRYVAAQDACGTVARTYLWTCGNRAEIASLKVWLASRKGRAVPFWLPTWRVDLLLASSIGPADVTMEIQATGYTRFLWPQVSRKHVAIIHPDGSAYYRKITSSVDNGSTETLGLSSALGLTAPPASVVCFLALCRLDTDEPEITYLTDAVAEARLPFIEIPAEEP